MRITHSFTDDSATIRIEGLARPVRMLHLTDTHLQFFDERDGENYDACVDYCRRYAKRNEEQGTDYVPGDAFRRNLTQAARENLDLLALTGDIVHFPSPASVDFVLEFVHSVTTAPNLAAVFCGHVHIAHADAINTRAVQYVGRPGFEGGRRLVEFRPL